jgi:hypothetical protein
MAAWMALVAGVYGVESGTKPALRHRSGNPSLIKKDIPRREVAVNVFAEQYESKSKSKGNERVRTYPPEHRIHSLKIFSFH